MPGAFGKDGYGTSPYGSAPLFGSFRVSGAVSLSPIAVLVSFNAPLDLTFGPLTLAGNYSIPGLTVISASIFDATSVLLTTSLHASILYTVTVVQALNFVGDPLDPLYRTATFFGTPANPAYYPVGVRNTRIRIVFSEAMLLNAAILDSNSYVVTDIQGNFVPVTTVVSEQGATNPLTVVLTLGTEMQAAEWYVVTVGTGVVSAATGFSVAPAMQKFQWIEPTLNSAIAIVKFSGEATSGLLTDHAGLVYFSPALDVAVSGSIIQVDSVEVCTKAFDEYVLPSPPDPPALYTFSGLTAPTGELNSSAVLWGAFPRLSEASLSLAGKYEETFSPPVDSRAHATFTEPWDKSFVALLNNPAWALYDGMTAVTPPTFICANNLGPIPPGPTTTIILQPP